MGRDPVTQVNYGSGWIDSGDDPLHDAHVGVVQSKVGQEGDKDVAGLPPFAGIRLRFGRTQPATASGPSELAIFQNRTFWGHLCVRNAVKFIKQRIKVNAM